MTAAAKISAILARHAGLPKARIEASTPLSALEIDLLDLPIVILDIEDAFHICVPHEDYAAVETVAALVACVEARLHQSAIEIRALAETPRVRRPWTCTGAEQRG